jgi:DNA-binding transcriptional LysR family regulator
MDINRVRYFCVVANCGSLIKASEILRISQPALSKAVRVLEEEVGLPLLEREGRGLRLTEAGKKFRASAEPILNEWLAIPSLLKGQARETILRIGSFEVFTTYFVGHLLKQITLPEFELHEFTPGRLEDAICDGLIDVGITYHPISRRNVNFTEVTKIRMGIFGNEAFLKIPFSELPFVIPNDLVQGTPSKVMGLDGWPDHKFPRRTAFKVTMMESALELCRRGKAVAYLPEFVVGLQNEEVKNKFELKELDCPIPKKDRLQSVFIVQESSKDETPFIRAVARALRSLA